jgi:hypothetical protein
MNRYFNYLMNNVRPGILQAYMQLEEGEELEPVSRQDIAYAAKGQNTLEVMHATRAFGSETVMMMVLSVKRPKWNPEKLTDRELYRAPIIRMARKLRIDLENLGVQDVEVLDMCGVSRLTRMYWDVAGIHSFYNACARGVYPKNDDEIEVDPDGKVQTDTGHWPVGRIVVKNNYIWFENRWRAKEFDDEDLDERTTESSGTFHRVLMLVKRPADGLPDSLEHIKTFRDGWTTMTSVSETMPGEVESWLLTKQISLRRSMSEGRNSNYETPPEQEAREEEEAEHRELHSGGNVVQKSNKLFVISDVSLEGIDEIQETLEALYRGSGFGVMEVHGSYRQARAFVSGMAVSML